MKKSLDKELFTSTNKLDQNVIIYILEFLSRNELNLLASLFYRPHSEEIINEFYNQTLLNTIKFGKCLMIYSWSDWFWKDAMNNKIELINSVICTKIQWNQTLSNYRLGFIKEIWNRIDVDNWKRILEKRNERLSYIGSIGDKISEIAQLNGPFKNVKCERLIRKRITEQIFIEESTIQEPLQEPFKLDPKRTDFHCMKWVSMGATGIGKTSLLIRVGYNSFPEEYTPTVFDSYSKIEHVKCLLDGIETQMDYQSEYWDTAGGEEYDRLRPLSYPNTSVFTMNYAINDFSSLKYLVEHLMWECTLGAPTATFLVVSTKNDLRDSLYWNSLFTSTVEEPISKQEGIEFTKAIGAVSFIETSAKSAEGTSNFDRRLALLTHTHLNILENPQIESKKEHKKTCTFQ